MKIIIQISDFHFGNKLNQDYTKGHIEEIDFIHHLLVAVENDFSETTEIIFALLGDFANKAIEGNYIIAQKFFAKMAESFQKYSFRYILCPGNHDFNIAANDHAFNYYNSFSISLTKDDVFTFNDNKTTSKIRINNIDFISVNSVFHKSHEYGLVDIDSLRKTLKTCTGTSKIVLVHHNLIPIFNENNSTIKNSYEFIRLCVENRVSYILHGHTHIGFILNVSDKSKSLFCGIIGVGSFLGTLGGNYNNQFNIMSFNAQDEIIKIVNYRLVNDSYSTSNWNFIKEDLI